MIVAVDTMGGDNAPKAQIDAAIDAVKEYGVEIVFLGDENTIKKHLEGKSYDFNKISIVHCSENIDNDEKPVISIKKKKDSPMVKGCNMLNDKKVDALVSSGSTGALLRVNISISSGIWAMPMQRLYLARKILRLALST